MDVCGEHLREGVVETCGREFLDRCKFPSLLWEFTSALREAELGGACLALQISCA